MNKQDYKTMMDQVTPDFNMKAVIYQNISKKSASLISMKKMMLATAAILLCFSLIYQSSGILDKEIINLNPTSSFFLEVQAKDGIKQISSAEDQAVVIQNQLTIDPTDTKLNCIFIDDPQANEKQLFLSLPLEIKGDNIEKIEYEISGDFAYLIPRYTQEDKIIGDTEEEILKAYDQYHNNPLWTNSYFKGRTYSEMSKEGKKVFKKYVELFKDEILNDEYAKTNMNKESDLYQDQFTSYIISKLSRCINDANTNQPSEEKIKIATQFAIDRARYFEWNRDENTKKSSFTFDDLNKKNVSLLLTIKYDQWISGEEQLFKDLENSNLKITVYFKNGISKTKNICYKGIDEKTGNYLLEIK